MTTDTIAVDELMREIELYLAVVEADNSKKLGGQTADAIAASAAQRPGPASSAAGLFTVKTTAWSLGAGGLNDFAVMCDSGQKAISGGFEDPTGYAVSWDTRPTADGAGWRTVVGVSTNAPGAQNGTVYAVCVR